MLGKFEIIEEVGHGGFARVYRARNPDLDVEVALKVLSPRLTWEPAFVKRFHQEAQATAKLRHPNIVRIHDVGRDEEDLYIAMEYLDGQTLAQLLEDQGALALDRALPILEQVASALDYAHDEGVVHRDVKPSNVMVQEGRRGALHATLTDFGLVKVMQSSEVFTSTGSILGSPHYMAPEQADIKRTDEIGPATDLYSLGVVAYEMLVGQLPFPGDTTSTLMARVLYDPPDPQSLRDDLPEDVAQVLLKALSREGKDRYPDAGAMVEALRESAEAREEARQREEQLVHLYQQIEASVEAEDWRTAEARCREILALDPEYRDVPELWMRVRSERARQREVEQLYQAAQAASERRSWVEVKDLCLQIQALEPAYRDVDALLAWAGKEERAEQLAAERQAQLAALYSQAQAALEGRRWEEAERLCNEMRALEPGYRGVDGLLRQAQGGLQEAQAEEKKQERLAELHFQALAAMRLKRWQEVRRLCGEIEALEPGYRDTATMRARAEEELAQEQVRRRAGAVSARAQDEVEGAGAGRPVQEAEEEEGEVAAAAGKEELPAPVEEAPVLGEAPVAPEPGPIPAKKRVRVSRRVWVAGLVAVALVIVGVVAIALSQAAQDRTSATRTALAWAAGATQEMQLTSTAEAQADAYATKSVAWTATAEVRVAARATQAARLTSTAEARVAATGRAAGTATMEAAATAVAEALRLTSTAEVVASATEAAAQPLPEVPAGWKAQIQETFGDSNLGWDEGDYEGEWVTGSQRISGGIYRWEVTESGGAFWRSIPDLGYRWGDLHLTVEARRTQGAGAYGLVFRYVDGDNFYECILDESTEETWVYKLMDDEWVTLGRFEKISAIHPGETNRLTVLGIGSRFQFFVNDQFVGELDDDTHARGSVGVALDLIEGDTGSFEFDNLELYTP
jgi:hypothetical protein